MKARPLLKAIPIETKETVLNYLKVNGPTKSNTPELYRAIEKSSYRALEDIFRYLEEKEGLLKKEKIGRAWHWSILDKEAISKELVNRSNLSDILSFSEETFDKDTLDTLKKIFQSGSDYISGQLVIYEEFNNLEKNELILELIEAIKNREYLRLYFKYDKINMYDNVKPIKIIFLDNNWYIAFEYKNDTKETKFVLRRLAFLKEIKFLKDMQYFNKNRFQKKDIQKYIDFLNNIQNSLTLFGKSKTTATLKALPDIAKYFYKDMKKFLKSQKFLQKLEDGSVIFTVEYTQPLEILPLVQKWMPDLIIIAPKELKEAYKKKLETALKQL
jgi:hypothetical protein